VDHYAGREQTQAKHFILKRYLQELAFKVLTFQDITYIDGFSGPWESKTTDFSDSSFMIAISVLLDAQKQVQDRTGEKRKIRCFLSEANKDSFTKLQAAVAPFHKPAEGFEIQTFCGEFADAVGQIQRYIGTSFALIFIDPTGWTGYPFDKINPLFARAKCEVLINFMYDFIRRFVNSEDPEIIASFEPIFGGPGWRDRLDPALERGPAAEKLFRETLKTAGKFEFVVSTKIDKSTADRPHFFITYGTKSLAGLKAFRETEFVALRQHEHNRANAKERERQARTGTADLFAGQHATVQEATIEDIVAEQMATASIKLVNDLKAGARPFSVVLESLLQSHMLRPTNVKDICVALAKAGTIENTWGGGVRKPQDNSIIRLVAVKPSE
jgi:three-Cys-motif partner protein